MAPESVDYTQFNPKKRWRSVQELIRQTWHRWMREYLKTLGSRSKWYEQQENVKKGDVVLVIDPNVARRNWKLGVIYLFTMLCQFYIINTNNRYNNTHKNIPHTVSDKAGYMLQPKIEDVYPGKDDMVRVVNVREGHKVYRRSIGRISPLELGQRTTRTENGSVRNPGGGGEMCKRLYLDKNFVNIFYYDYVTAKKCEHAHPVKNNMAE